jgi:hypothetical protein
MAFLECKSLSKNAHRTLELDTLGSMDSDEFRGPAVLRHDLRRQPVRKWTPERHAIGSHACWLQADARGIQ